MKYEAHIGHLRAIARWCLEQRKGILTPKQMYCTELNPVGRSEFYPGHKPVKVIADIVLRCKVRFLKRSPIPNDVVEKIHSGLTTFA